MKKFFKYFSMVMMIVFMTVSFSSCKDDDKEPTLGIDDYYSECSSVTGDKLSAQEASALKTAISSVIQGTWKGLTREEATYEFNKEVEVIARSLENYYDSNSLHGKVTTVIVLRTVSSGKKVYSKTIYTDSNGSDVR